MYDNRAVFGDPGGDYLMSMGTAAKIYSGDLTVRICNQAMELMGAYGYSEDYLVAKYLRDTKIFQIMEGGTHEARIDVARGYYPVHGPELAMT